jgi:hypothetical protein
MVKYIKIKPVKHRKKLVNIDPKNEGIRAKNVKEKQKARIKKQKEAVKEFLADPLGHLFSRTSINSLDQDTNVAAKKALTKRTNKGKSNKGYRLLGFLLLAVGSSVVLDRMFNKPNETPIVGGGNFAKFGETVNTLDDMNALYEQNVHELPKRSKKEQVQR